MIAGTLAWWRDRSRREQWLLAIMLALMLALIGWFGVVRPLRVARADAADRLARATADLGDIAARSTMIRAAEAVAHADDATPLLDLVRQRASDAGIAEPPRAGGSDSEVMLQIAAIKPAVLLGWLAGIETRDGVAVERLVLTPNADATVAADIGLRRARR